MKQEEMRMVKEHKRPIQDFRELLGYAIREIAKENLKRRTDSVIKLAVMKGKTVIKKAVVK